jgi:ATP-dependent Clp protease ATP-binding subunit ClpB
MRYDKLTIKSQEALGEAQSQAGTRGHSEIHPAHLLRALLAQPEGSTVPVLQKLGISLEQLQSELERILASLPKVSGGAQSQLARSTSRVLEAAFKEAEQLKDEYVST